MASKLVTFGEFRFDMSTRELVRAEAGGSAVPLPLGSRAADILLLFLQRPGELLTKNEIMSAVWPDTAVEDSNLTVQISAVRRALDGDRAGTSAISTVPGRGYRFTLPVQGFNKDESAPAPAAAQNLDSNGAITASSGQAAAPANASTRQSSRSGSSWNRFGFAGMPRWIPLAAIAAVAIPPLVALGLLWGGVFTRHPDDRAASEATTYYIGIGRGFASREDFDHAIADFNEAIRLDPSSARAYLERARVHRYQGDYDGAVADAGKTIELAPYQHLGFLERGNDYLAKGDLEHAIADYNTAIRLTPTSNESFFGRGQAYFFGGDMTKAQADFQASIEIVSKWPLPALWLAVAQRRGKLPGLAQQDARRFGPGWPTPVLRMLVGELTPAQTLTAANNKDPVTQQRQVCQANFYSGELAFSNDAADDALRLFRLAADQCPPTYTERPAALAELRASSHPR